jgi:hypothetical protein
MSLTLRIVVHAAEALLFLRVLRWGGAERLEGSFASGLIRSRSRRHHSW